MRSLASRLINVFLSNIEKSLFKYYYIKPKIPPFFVLGLPRSGTTLLYQYIVHRLEVSYFMNGTDRFWYTPLLNTWIRYKIFGNYRSDFKNEYGKVPGPNAPHEAGKFWGQFYGYHDYIEYEEIKGSDIKKMQHAIAGIEQVFGGWPFVNKNVKHLLRLQVLAEIFPQSIFIIIDRNIEDVALSLLRGRYKNLGSASGWWSIRPPNWRDLNDLDPPRQIGKQLLSLEEKLFEDLENISSNRVLKIDYEEFCGNPEGFITKISDLYSIRKKDTKIKIRFEKSENVAKTAEESQLIKYLRNECRS